MLGKGKYGDIAARVHEETHADGVIVMVMQGDRGSGFSVIGDLRLMHILPKLLREMADDIEISVNEDPKQ